jgi:hypothetical protein
MSQRHDFPDDFIAIWLLSGLPLLIVEEQNRRGDGGRPIPVLGAYSRLGDIGDQRAGRTP